MSLSGAQWEVFGEGANRIAKSVREATGLRTVFHPHCAGFVETPDEVETFLAHTDPALVGLVLDTGHFVYGSGANDAGILLDALERFKSRLWYVHFKDVDPEVATRARRDGLSYKEADRRGRLLRTRAGLRRFCGGQGGAREGRLQRLGHRRARRAAGAGHAARERRAQPGVSRLARVVNGLVNGWVNPIRVMLNT